MSSSRITKLESVLALKLRFLLSTLLANWEVILLGYFHPSVRALVPDDFERVVNTELKQQTIKCYLDYGKYFKRLLLLNCHNLHSSICQQNLLGFHEVGGGFFNNLVPGNAQAVSRILF